MQKTKRKNPFYEIIKPDSLLNAPTVCHMERTWDKAIDKVLSEVTDQLFDSTLRRALLARIEKLKSTNQRGDKLAM